MLPKTGRFLPGGGMPPERRYAAAIAVALSAELGDTHRAVKTVMRWTGASERTVKNWFAGTTGPNGEHLIEVVRHSDAAFDTIMLLAGRKEVVAARKLADARETLVAMLELVVDLTA